MNTLADKHVAKGQGYLERGEEFYRKAAEEFLAAKEADPTLSNAEIARQTGRSNQYIGRLLTAVTRASETGTFEVDWNSGSNVRSNVVTKTLRDAPMEQVEQIIADLPAERQKAVAAAAGHGYLKARVELEDEERNRTPAQRKEREAAADALADSGRKATAGFATLGIAGHIEQATDELTELVADASLSPETLQVVLRADAAWRHELQVAAAMVGLEVDLAEVR